MTSQTDKASPDQNPNDSQATSSFPLHGGNPQRAAEAFKVNVDTLIDFSASVNQMGPPKCVMEQLGQSFPQILEYPDPANTALKSALSNYCALPAERIIVGNGSSELIHALPCLLREGKSVALIEPAFSEYRRAFEIADRPIITFTGAAEHQFLIPLNALLHKLDQAPEIAMLVLGNPTCPAGTLWPRQDIETLLSYCETRKILLVIDETFIEFTDGDNSLVGKVPESHSLILIRSMTKFHALPGLRIGYGLMSPEHIANIEKGRVPWSVNGLAQSLGVAALQDKEFPSQSREWNRDQRKRLLSGFAEIENIETFPSQTNFILFRIQSNNPSHPAALYERLIRDGVLLRNCGNFPGLDINYFRCGVRKEADNRQLLHSLREQCARLASP
ncbi:MAG: threonine-phosphate decarboxylase [Candidatus Nitrohelix vancouverensis]|uniref:threonine-phosphate decarboxylase n=1 Tax=Candidatus Nitrohelix vancouverensis TaxID=2705534 RepID=A0A7T0C4Z0_9BACT|nr:MAG: threonine-phosphate decarboxylase [Candidatus Nitrohelix vancouverensis]